MNSLLDAKVPLFQLLMSKDLKDKKNIETIKDDEFWDNLESTVTFLKPFIQTISIVESDGSMLSDVVEQCIEHRERIETMDLHSLNDVKDNVI